MTLNVPLTVKLRTVTKHGRPAIEIRRLVIEEDVIREIVRAAFYEEPIVIMPSFTDKIKSIGTLIEKGVLYVENEKFYFNI